MPASNSLQQGLKLLQKNNSSVSQLRDLFSADAGRFEAFSRQYKGLLLDFSRVALTKGEFGQLLRLAEQGGVSEQRERMFRGEVINHTEARPVLHHLWRSRSFSGHLPVADATSCETSLLRMEELATTLHAGYLPGQPDTRISDIVHIGIGGSLIGPKLLYEALPAGEQAPAVHFLSSVDALEREQLLPRLDPSRTVIVLVSKSFTTTEVLAHGRRVRDWMQDALGKVESGKRLIAISSVPAKAKAFGVPEDRVLAMGEWTGGRYSIWSPVGLSVAIAAGPAAFAEFCAGGAAMDGHFRTASTADNLPIIHGLLSVWHRNVCDYPGRGLIPYDSRLRGLPAWLQQLQMESNGKSVQSDGSPVELQTSPMVFGDCGTDAQHALFQAFHQGTSVVPLDFVGVIQPDHDDLQAQQELLSHLLAQATALAFGRNADETRAMMQAEGKLPDQIEALLPHRIMPGNRPSSILMLDRLDAFNLGMLLALYEHSIFVESVIWQINAFDQWGVELGKVLAGQIGAAMHSGAEAGSQELASLKGMLQHIRQRGS
ncbi:MAG TPA: glucose-6-phosphate isomerase [Xanthomonadales bacterium]|nr:glucose-6-phosphate isomerase [Xanthomonadales bacterium]